MTGAKPTGSLELVDVPPGNEATELPGNADTLTIPTRWLWSEGSAYERSACPQSCTHLWQFAGQAPGSRNSPRHPRSDVSQLSRVKKFYQALFTQFSDTKYFCAHGGCESSH
jgi:hypothetical protein